MEGEALDAWKLDDGFGKVIFDREPEAVDGEPLLSASVDGHDRTVVAHDDRFGFDVERSFELTVRATALHSPRPVQSRFPFHYHILPGFLRRFAGKTLIARKQFVQPDHGAELLRHARRVLSAVEPPRSLLILTHDVDTRHGLARAVRLAEEEARRNLSAVYFVVPGMRRLDTGAVRLCGTPATR